MDSVVLKSIPYRDDDRILTLFTQHEGIVSVMAKGAKKKDFAFINATSPLSRSEFIYSKGRGDLFYCRDVSLIDPYLEIRDNLERLQSAGRMLQALRTIHVPEGPSPKLFQLLTLYLHQLKSFPSPTLIALSFLIKLLKHEGLFSLNRAHSAILFNDHEWATLQICYLCTRFHDLEGLATPPLLSAKIEDLLTLSLR